ncbi:adenylate kinase isoenzyme 5 isoform X2 [Daktulosphaira vitifoliae]|nr:adenylate kinase isoenzyme 5 isoform X2 [Daktulosphaira vitifoliae]
MEDFSKLSSNTVTEVLMLELKMSPAAKTFLISGFPRNMRDVVEYTQKIKSVNGVILIAWSQSVLERQIDYGAKLGHVVLSLARMELNNFYKNVTPVSEYYDQRGMLISVNGERSPSEVYNDFRSSVLQILSAHRFNETSPPALSNGHIPNHQNIASNRNAEEVLTRETVIEPNDSHHLKHSNYPKVICVVGGPGSNKSSLCQKVLRANPGWGHVSMGPTLRSLASAKIENDPVQKAISNGQLVNKEFVCEILNFELSRYTISEGVVIDGFPRTINQLNYFEKEYAQQPILILLDCSKLQLGRGRLDDSVLAFRRRLENFREETLPMLKQLDENNRLIVVDGNTDERDIQEKFFTALVNTMKKEINNTFHQVVDIDGTELQDLENNAVPPVEDVSRIVVGSAVPHQNGFLPNNQPNNTEQLSQHGQAIRTMYAQIGTYPKENVF